MVYNNREYPIVWNEYNWYVLCKYPKQLETVKAKHSLDSLAYLPNTNAHFQKYMKYTEKNCTHIYVSTYIKMLHIYNMHLISNQVI